MATGAWPAVAIACKRGEGGRREKEKREDEEARIDSGLGPVVPTGLARLSHADCFDTCRTMARQSIMSE
jgi:hypothetical protein